MRTRKLLWRLFPSYLLITLLSLIAITWYSSQWVRRFYIEQTRLNLEARARLAEREVSALLETGDSASIDRLSKDLGKRASTRITVILPTGKVVGDSDRNPSEMDNHADRPAVIEALAGKMGSSIRYSYTLGENLMYVAAPLRDDGVIKGVVRVAIPLTSLNAALRAVYFEIVLGGVAIALLAAIVSLAVSRRLSRPLEEIRRGADWFSRGELERRLPRLGLDELDRVAEAMNQMAAQLDERIRRETRQRQEQSAILSSMSEGVIAVDASERIISMNRAAADMLGADPDDARGKNIQEVARNVSIQKFLTGTFAAGEMLEKEIALHGKEARFIQVRAAPLKDVSGKNMGTVLVLNDVTHIRRLENMRKDFVANVSHELKTPITSIKGFVETLLDGALEDPQNAEKFLKIVAKQVDRLNAIIEDLLLLSVLERSSRNEGVTLESGCIRDVLETAVEVCRAKADGKNIEVEVVAPANIEATMNAPLLEQAVVNLLDNAIKYSPPDGVIHLEASMTASVMTISVRDEGIGIEGEHLTRLFERFYRVDKARSRKLGGTGLGLAIVKHIAEVHGGSVAVDSKPGMGSVFSIHIPL